jgi:catechol 2,3-dioxygenase-like lactoylglutathione lyase family enzyme
MMRGVTEPLNPEPRTAEPGDLVSGLHHIRIPVTDPWVSRDWYIATLGMVPVLDEEDEDQVVGVVLRHPEGFVIGLHRDPGRAASLRGFAVVGVTLDDHNHLRQLCSRLDERQIDHGPPTEGHIGSYLDVPDPDGILIRFHTGTAPDAEQA